MRLLRIVARARADHGAEAVDALQAALGGRIFDAPRGEAEAEPGRPGTRDFLEPVLREVGLPIDLADALDDTSWDEVIRADGEEALALTGQDVGTPIIHFEPPDGEASFGPVISRLPEPTGPESCGTTSSAWPASQVSPS